jgi:putative DNA primase/helicase
MSTATTYAKQLASIGCQVFPLAPKGKVPLKGSHSFYDATSDLPQIDKWASQNPRCNWGLATGQRSGVVVLEVDLRRSGDKTLAKIQDENGKLPKSVTVISPSGGPHIYLRQTQPTPSKMDPFGPGIELKADKNLVVVAGSVGKNGTRYRYDNGRSPDVCEIAPLPGWIIDYVS